MPVLRAAAKGLTNHRGDKGEALPSVAAAATAAAAAGGGGLLMVADEELCNPCAASPIFCEVRTKIFHSYVEMDTDFT